MAAVLPLPVCAIPSISLPSKRAGIQACWIGEGVSNQGQKRLLE